MSMQVPSHNHSAEQVSNSPSSTPNDSQNVSSYGGPDLQTLPSVQRPESYLEALAVVVDAMFASPDDEQLQYKAIVSMSRIVHKRSSVDISNIHRTGCIQAIIAAMTNFAEMTYFIRKGCFLLVSVAFRSQDNQNQICKSGGIELLATLMKRNEGDEKSQSVIFHALRNITEQIPRIQRYVVHLGLLEVIGHSLERFKENIELQIHAIAVIGNIACSGLEAQRRIRECGCLELIIQAMGDFSGEFSVQERCVNSLRNVCYRNESNQRMVGKLGGIELLTQLLENHQKNAPFLVEVCSTIRYMCLDEENRKMMNARAVEQIVKSLEPVSNYCEGADVEKVLKSLSNATFSPEENKRNMVTCGGIPAVMKVLHKLKNDPGVLCSGLRAFRNITDKGRANSKLLADVDVFSFGIERIRCFKEHEGLSEQLFTILLDIIEDDYDQEKIGMPLSEVKETVSTQLQNLSSSVPVQQIGRSLYIVLEKYEQAAIEAEAERGGRKRSLLRKFRRIAS